MKKAIVATTLLLLPSLLSAKPTIGPFWDDQEIEASLRSEEAAGLRINEIYWWLGRWDLFQAICRYTMPTHLTVWGVPGAWAPWMISSDTGDPCSCSDDPEVTFGPYLSVIVVRSLKSECPLDVNLAGAETIANADRGTFLPLALDGLIAH